MSPRLVGFGALTVNKADFCQEAEATCAAELLSPEGGLETSNPQVPLGVEAPLSGGFAPSSGSLLGSFRRGALASAACLAGFMRSRVFLKVERSFEDCEVILWAEMCAIRT